MLNCIKRFTRLPPGCSRGVPKYIKPLECYLRSKFQSLSFAMAPFTKLALAALSASSSFFTLHDIYSEVNCTVSVSYSDIATLPQIIRIQAPLKNTSSSTQSLTRSQATHKTSSFNIVLAQINPQLTTHMIYDHQRYIVNIFHTPGFQMRNFNINNIFNGSTGGTRNVSVSEGYSGQRNITTFPAANDTSVAGESSSRVSASTKLAATILPNNRSSTSQLVVFSTYTPVGDVTTTVTTITQYAATATATPTPPLQVIPFDPSAEPARALVGKREVTNVTGTIQLDEYESTEQGRRNEKYSAAVAWCIVSGLAVCICIGFFVWIYRGRNRHTTEIRRQEEESGKRAEAIKLAQKWWDQESNAPSAAMHPAFRREPGTFSTPPALARPLPPSGSNRRVVSVAAAETPTWFGSTAATTRPSNQDSFQRIDLHPAPARPREETPF